MTKDLLGKTAIVTGASKGIGYTIAEHLMKEGCNVILMARNTDALKKATLEMSENSDSKVKYIAADLSSAGGCTAAATEALKAFDRIDILINCAGATKAGVFPEQSDEEWNDGFSLKFFGSVRLCRALWPELSRNKGTVINIGGGATYTPSAGFMVGGAVNAALAHFSKSLSLQGLKDDVNVNIVHPGMTVSDRMFTLFEQQAKLVDITVDEVMHESVKKSGLRRLGQTEDVAVLVTFLCLPKARHIQGQGIAVDGGATPGLN